MNHVRLVRIVPVLCCLYQIPAAAQAQSPPVKRSAPLTGPSSGDPQVDLILDRLEVKGAAIKGLKCDLIYKYVTPFPVVNEQTKEGTLLFARAQPNSKFLIHFEKLIVDDVKRDTGEYFLFDGQWLTERNDKAKTINKTQIARPGEQSDPFKLGKGPFPLPFGQKRADILENFKVTMEKFTLGDPRGSKHLHCIPLETSELARKYSRVEIYIDPNLELPVRIVSENKKDDSRIEVDFKNIDLNSAAAGSRFRIEEPKDYQITNDPLEDSGAVPEQPARRP